MGYPKCLFCMVWNVRLRIMYIIMCLCAYTVTCNTNATCGSNSYCHGETCKCSSGFSSLMGSNTDCANLSGKVKYYLPSVHNANNLLVPNEVCTTSNCLYCPSIANCQRYA